MSGRLLRLALLVALAASVSATAVTRRTSQTRHAVAPAGPAAAPAAKPPRVHRPQPIRLLVTVIDGDRRVRVGGARVRLAGTTGVADRAGLATIVVRKRQTVPVTVTAKGYSTKRVTLDFAHSREQTVRIYRPDLQWPMYGVDATRTQAQLHIRLRPPFKTVWSLPLGGLIEFPAVVEDGVAYIGNAHASVRAISMRFGTQIWRHDTTPAAHMASSPAVAGPDLVYHTMDGHVFVLDASNGHVRWSYDVGSPIESSPIVSGGVDYFGAWNGNVYALDLRTHRLRWTRSLGAKITSSAAISGGTLYIGDYGGHLWALAAGSGATRWTGTVNGRIYGTPAVAGGRIFVPSSTGYSLTAFSTAGRQLWRVSTGGYVYSSPATAQGRVFFGSYDGNLYGVSAASGHVLWRVAAGGPISGAAVVVDGVAYAGSFAHEIVGVDAASGKRVLTFDHGRYVPVSGNGMRLLFHGYSRLYAVEPKSASTAKHRAVTRITATHDTSARAGT
jgi:outer membrane protein assembly factor BamB